jgi:hypothetical protein
MLWRRKQGRGDWEDSSGVQRSFTTVGQTEAAASRTAEEEDWDIEKAVGSRNVQVMFTVPKERLRVVNQDVEESDDDNEQDIGVRRMKSKRSIRSKRSVMSLGKGKGREGDVSKGETSRPSTPVLPSPRISRPPSPAKSIASVKSGRVAELVHEMEKRDGK